MSFWSRTSSALDAVDWWLDGPLLRPLRRLVGALIVAAGPWIVSIIALALVAGAMERVRGPAAVEDLRLAVVYAFALAPLASAPVGVIAARRISSAGLAGPDAGRVLVAALALAGLTAQALAVSAVLLLPLPDISIAAAFVTLTAASAMMWTAFSVLTALRALRRLILSFCFGMALASTLALVSVRGDPSVAQMTWCFTLGVTACLALAAAPLATPATHANWRALRSEAARAWPLGLGAGLAILGVWADKVIYWFGPEGLRSQAGFAHFPTYDTVMFLAHLSVLPCLAALLAMNEGPIAVANARVQRALGEGHTLDTLLRAVEGLNFTVWDRLQAVMLTQFALSLGLLLVSPLIAQAAGLGLEQFLILRTGLMGAFLHALFLAATGVMVLCNRKARFAALHGLFLALNLGLSLAFSASFGVTAYGFLAAAALGCAVALPLAWLDLRNLAYLHMLRENEALYTDA